MFQHIIETSASVQSFAIEEHIYLLSDKRIQVFDTKSYEKIAERQFFEKDGSARSFIMDETYIYCKDFVHLYILEKKSLNVLTKLQLGTDLSSDICGMTLDNHYVYAGIRNGTIARIEKTRWEHIQYYPLSTSSIWSMQRDENRIYAGNVDGQLLLISTETMQVAKSVQAHKQNAKSVCLVGNIVATASQDLSLACWDKHTLERINGKKNAHKRAFTVIGCWDEHFLTVSFPCGEMKVWDSTTLQEKYAIPITPCLSGETCLIHSHLYLSSRAIKGIDYADIATIKTA